jgi:hypothetical protein
LIDRHGRLGAALPIVPSRSSCNGARGSPDSIHVTTAGRQGVSLGGSMALSGRRSTAIAMRYHQAGAVLRNPATRLAD